MNYPPQPLSDFMERRIRERLEWLKLELVKLRKSQGHDSIAVLRVEGNIGALEWVLREAENPS